MKDEDDRIPTVGTHRGVGLHDQQSSERLTVVRRAIDDVFNVADPKKLQGIAYNPSHPPEARLLAAAKLEALMAIAADERAIRPNINLDFVRASVAGLNSAKWRDRTHFASMLDHGRAPDDKNSAPVAREMPLVDD